MFREATPSELEQAFLSRLNGERLEMLKTMSAVFALDARRAVIHTANDAGGKVISGISFAPEDGEAKAYSAEELAQFNGRLATFCPELEPANASHDVAVIFGSFFEQFTLLELGGLEFNLQEDVLPHHLFVKETNAYLESGGVMCPVCGSTDIASVTARPAPPGGPTRTHSARWR
jgi:hypothetical protein